MVTKQDLKDLISLPFNTMDRRPSFIPIESAHISGISYLNIGDAGIELLSEFSNSGFKVSVPTTMNPGFTEIIKVGQICSIKIYEKQKLIVDLLRKMGINPSLTCVPYFHENVPRPGSHLAWAESSAVLYVNSIIGAWSNKESGISALASAIMGFTADIGVHKSDGRKPKVKAIYEGSLMNELEAGALGYILGEVTGDRIPYVKAKGLTHNHINIIEFLAAFGTSGFAPMISIEGISPVRKLDIEIRDMEVIRISEKQIRSLIEELSSDEEPEAVVIGCPHVTLETIKMISENKKRFSLPTFVFTSSYVKDRVKETKLMDNIEKRGVKLIANSCVMWCGLKEMEIRTVITNSMKAAYYLKNQLNVKTVLKPLSDILGTKWN